MATAFVSSQGISGGVPVAGFTSGTPIPETPGQGVPATGGARPSFGAAGALGLGAITQASKEIQELVDSSAPFTDVETLAQPFVEAFDKFSSTAQEALTAELRLAEDDLQAFQNNNQDVRAAVNLTAAREVKSQIFNATLSAASEVNNRLAQGVFAASQLASQNFANISQTVASASTALAGATSSFVASLTSSASSVFSAELNHAGQMAQIAASRDIAQLQAATTRRGQDIEAALTREQIDAQRSSERLQSTPIAAPDVRAPAGLNLTPPVAIEPTRTPTRLTSSTINPVRTVDFERI